VPQVPNINDINRAKRVATDRFNYKNLIGQVQGASVVPYKPPQVIYDYLYVSGLSNTVTIGGEPAASEEINGVYMILPDYTYGLPPNTVYIKWPYIVTPYMDYILGRATDNYWGLGRYGGQNDNNVCTSTVSTSSILPAGNAAWSVIDVTLSDATPPNDTPVSIHITGQVSIRYDVID